MLFAALTLAAASSLPADESSNPALEPVASKAFDDLQALPGLDLSAFDAVFVAQPQVTFRKNWRRDQSRSLRWRVRDEDVERIKADLSGMVREVFVEEFTNAGYRLADAPSEGVLVVRPDIIELNVVAPDIRFPGRYFQYSEYAGQMTLDLELRDGASDEVLLALEDRKRDNRQGFFQWRTQVSNLAVARLWTRNWAREVRETMQNPS
jgi:hypothetical protein